MRLFSRFFSRHVVCIMAVIALLVYALTYLEEAFGPPIRSDGHGYYAYLPSYLLYFDPSFESLAREQYGGEMPEWTGVRRHPETGKYLNRYPIGVAVLLLPFFLAAHLTTLVCYSPVDWHKFNYAPDGYSFFYQHAAGLGALCYAVVGLFFLKKALERYFTPSVSAVTVALLFVGTNLLHYGSGGGVTAHPFAFCLFALFLYWIPRWYDVACAPRLAVALGAIAGLIALVRVPDLLILLFFPLYGVSRMSDARRRLTVLRRRYREGSFMAGAMAIVILPQLLVWRYAAGEWFVNSYKVQGDVFQFLQPEVWNVLFSVRKGLFFWSPLLLFALVGLIPLWRKVRGLMLPSVLFLALNTYLISSWWMWWYGASFGHRAFVESYTVLAFPLAAVLAASGCVRMRRTVLLILGLTVVHSLFLMMLYYRAEISYYGLNWQAFYDALWWRKEWLLRLFGTLVAS